MSNGVTPAGIQLLHCGVVPYDEARDLQERLVVLRRTGRLPDTIVLLEHPPTITLGRRADARALGLSEMEWVSHGVDVRRTDRGGMATFHNPGQLIVYPVIDLPARRLGVRELVDRGLRSIAAAAIELGAAAEARLCPPGVWSGSAKLAAVGLRVTGGVTSHGFSVNVDNDLRPFSWFNPCDLPGVPATSLRMLSSGRPITVEDFKAVFVPCLLRELSR